MSEDRKKRLVFCFDGSWNKIDAPFPTNVLFTAESVLPLTEDGIAQVIFYDEGVGTEKGEEFKGGAFGAGLLKNLNDAYRTLIFNYTPGDDIFVFGFSRGAFTARSFVGLLSHSGILRRRDVGRVNEAVELYRQRNTSNEHIERMFRFRSESAPHICVSDEEDAWRAKSLADYVPNALPRLKVKYLGVWDTVGSLGVPNYLAGAAQLNREHQFHNFELSAIVESARHAVAIDEPRLDFSPTLWDNLVALNDARGADPADEKSPYQQVWFPGVHGAVGGGGDRRGLSDQPLDWIWDGARNAGLELDISKSSRIYELAPDHRDNLENASEKKPENVKEWLIQLGFGLLPEGVRNPGPQNLYEVSVSARRRWHDLPENLPEKTPYRPESLETVSQALNGLDLSALGMTAGGIEAVPENFIVHEVKQGEWLSTLAQMYYGDAALWPRIFAANKYKVYDPDRIYPGQALRIPQDY